MKKMLSALLLVATILCCSAATAQVVEPVDKHKLANGGYDMVAYFTDNAAVKGNPGYTVEYKGARYQFVSAANEKTFKNNPGQYLPLCDGYCAWGVAEKGKRVPVNPETFKIISGKLYLFFNGDFNGSPFNTLTEWNMNEDKLLAELPGKWAKLKKL